jgi:hypothetical protein
MQKVIATVVLSLAVVPAFAQKSCEDLKSEIAKKLDDKGVKNYQLNIVANDDVKDQKVVGSCEGGKKKIVYKKGKA